LPNDPEIDFRAKGMYRISRYQCLILLLAVVISSFFYVGPIVAQSTQTSYTVNLAYLSVQLSYPSQVMPGDMVTVNLQASPKSGVSGVSLTAQIFYADGTNLHQLASTTLSNGYNYYGNGGNSLSKQIQFTVPQDAPRTSLIGALTEKVQTAYYSYYYYPGYYNSSSSNCYYYPDYYYYSGYCSYYGYAYPSYSASTDTGVAPLSYIKATTPEYVSLQSEYQMVQQQLAQSQAENQQLKQNLQDAQNKIAQQNATIANLNQQLNSSQLMNGTVEAAAVGLGIIAIILGVFVAYLNRGRSRTPAKVKGETETK
jgi:hypothetical protein